MVVVTVAVVIKQRFVSVPEAGGGGGEWSVGGGVGGGGGGGGGGGFSEEGSHSIQFQQYSPEKSSTRDVIIKKKGFSNKASGCLNPLGFRNGCFLLRQNSKHIIIATSSA